jgi:Glycosyl transferase family 2
VSRWQFTLHFPRHEGYDADQTVEKWGGTIGVSLPLATFLRGYQLSVGYTSGVVLAAGLLVALAAVVGVGGARRSGLRAACFAWTAAGVGLLLTAAAFEFSWRYQLPGLVLLPVAAALGLTALTSRPPAAAGQGVGAAGEADAVDAAALEGFRRRYGEVAFAPVVVIIAAYNEADGIGPVIDSIPDRSCGLRVDTLVVVDGATDATAEVALAHGAYTCVAPVNRGQGAALRLGYRIARHGGASYLVTTDADGQYDIAELPRLLEPLLADQADFVTGSRRLGRQETSDPLRHLGVHVFAWLTSLLTRQRITDTSFGFRAMKAHVTARVTLAQPQYQSSELLIGVLARGFRVMEQPMTMRRRTAGRSKKGNNLAYGLRYARVVLGTWLREYAAGRREPAAPVEPAPAGVRRMGGPGTRPARRAGT